MEVLRKFDQISEIALPWPFDQEVYIRPWDKNPHIATLEKGIEKLCRVINGLGMQTTGSCEGHLDKTPYPWVQIAGLQYPDLWVYKRTVDLTEEYNHNKEEDKPEWCVTAWLATKEKASDSQELSRLQLDANDFAQYLFAKYLKRAD